MRERKNSPCRTRKNLYKGEYVMIENKIISEFLGEINGVEFKNPELYERCLGTLRIIGTAKEIDAKAVKGTKDFYVNLQSAKDITLKEIDDIASYGLFNSEEKFDWKTFKDYNKPQRKPPTSVAGINLPKKNLKKSLTKSSN